jgi:hypothetical protein
MALPIPSILSLLSIPSCLSLVSLSSILGLNGLVALMIWDLICMAMETLIEAMQARRFWVLGMNKTASLAVTATILSTARVIRPSFSMMQPVKMTPSPFPDRPARRFHSMVLEWMVLLMSPMPLGGPTALRRSLYLAISNETRDIVIVTPFRAISPVDSVVSAPLQPNDAQFHDTLP